MRTNLNTIRQTKGIQNLEEAMSAFGIDFGVDRVNLFTNRGGLKKITGTEAMIRTDSNSPIGIVSGKYPIIQPIDKFGIFRTFAEEGLLEFVEGGTSGKMGGRVYLQARIAGTLNLEATVGDIVEQRITFMSSYDGSRANEVLITPYRLACSNGMVISEKASARFRVRNTRYCPSRLEEAVLVIEEAVNAYRQLDAEWMKMLATPVQDKEVGRFVEMLLPATREVSETYVDRDGNVETIAVPETSTRTENRRQVIVETIHSGIGQAEIQGMNLWKLLNGVTCYTNHVEGERKRDRFDFLYFGGGEKLNTRAYELCTGVMAGEVSLS